MNNRIDHLLSQIEVLVTEVAFQKQKMKELESLLAIEKEKTEQLQKILVSIETKLPPKWATTAAMAAGTVTAVGMSQYGASQSSLLTGIIGKFFTQTERL